MHKRFAFFLILCILFSLSGCNKDKYEGKLTWDVAYDGSDAYTTFNFGNFCGTSTVEIERKNPGEGQFYYWIYLISGSVSCSYDGSFWSRPQPLFTADTGGLTDSYGGYIDRDGKIPVTFTAETPVSGFIVLSFAPYYPGLPQNPAEPVEGVGVYCWQNGKTKTWHCGALPGTDQPKSSSELLDLILIHNVASLEKMRYLLESRGLMDCTTVYYVDFSCTGGYVKDPEKYPDEYAYLNSAFGLN